MKSLYNFLIWLAIVFAWILIIKHFADPLPEVWKSQSKGGQCVRVYINGQLYGCEVMESLLKGKKYSVLYVK